MATTEIEPAKASVHSLAVRSHVGSTLFPALVLLRLILRQSPYSVRRSLQPPQEPCWIVFTPPGFAREQHPPGVLQPEEGQQQR